MTQRINYSKQSPQPTRKLFELSQAVKESGLNVPFQTPPGAADALLGLTKAGLT